MSFSHIAWASEQSQISPQEKLLAMFIAVQADAVGRSRFAVQDAASWCCLGQDSVTEELVYELAKKCGLLILGRDVKHDIPIFDVFVPRSKNGGELL